MVKCVRPLAASLSSAIFAVLLVATPARATVYYVDNLTPDCSADAEGSATGTLAAPWKNLQFAGKQLVCGDTLNIRRGTYRVSHAGFGNGTGVCENGSNGDASVLYLKQTCPANNPIAIQPYDPGSGPETVIIDGTSTQIDDASPATHWTQCESPSQCGACTGLALQDFTRTFYSEAYNFSSADTEQVWIDPACNEADTGCTNGAHTGTRLRWHETGNSGSCADLNLLDGACLTGWSKPACGSFNSRALHNAMVVRLPDSMADANPDHHVVKVSCQQGTCANVPVLFDGATNIQLRGRGKLFVKYGYTGISLSAGANNVLIDGVSINAAGGRDYGQCLRASNGNNNTIQHSVCAESASEGIAFYGGANCACQEITGNVAQYNTIHDNGYASSNCPASAVGTCSDSGALSVLDDGIIMKSCSNCVARGNTIYSTGRGGVKIISDANYGAFSTAQTCPGTLINTCASSNNIVEQNIIRDTCTSLGANLRTDSCAGLLVQAFHGGELDGSVLRNNSVYHIYGPSPARSVFPAVLIDSGVTNTTIVNNSIQDIGGACVNTRGASSNGKITFANNIVSKCSAIGECNGSGPCDLLMQTDTDLASHANNIYWAPTSSTQVVLIAGGNSYTRSTVTGFEPSAVQTGDPLFASLVDLHVLPGSAAIDRGKTQAGFANDIDGQARPQGQAWDIGADERDGELAAPALLSVEPLP
jgi:hypothetical protein